jgi:RNA polymerase sigma-70 factor (ECF subfamily)
VPDPEAERVSDEALLARAAAGDRSAFDDLVVRRAPSVLRLIQLHVGRPDDAEDVLQQTFLAAWRGAAGFRGASSARTWLFTIARHAAWRRRDDVRRHEAAAVPLDELGVRAGWGSEDPEALALAAERRDLLRATFDTLDPLDREVLTLRDLEGQSGEETAALLGLSLAAMKSRLHRARMTLAARVNREVARAIRRT